MSSSVRRILAATDRSETADRAAAWAAEMAERYGAELVLVQVVPPESPGDSPVADEALTDLRSLGTQLAGARARARVAVDPDPSRAICGAAEEEGADVLVVGGVGMSGRKEFLLGNVPNRVSHQAPCTVVIVDTRRTGKDRLGRLLRRDR